MENGVGTGMQQRSKANPQPPLRYAGGDLGFIYREDPWIEIVDVTGQRYLTHSVEWVLRNIDSFHEKRDRPQLLALSALHYGLDAFTLMGRRGLADYLAIRDRPKPLAAAALHYGFDTCTLTGRRNIQTYHRVW